MNMMDKIKERMLIGITEEQVAKVLVINEALTPFHWNKGMYDAFMLGYKLGLQDSEKR